MSKVTAALFAAALASAHLATAGPVRRETEIVCKSSDAPAYLNVDYAKQDGAPIRQRVWNASFGLAGVTDLKTQKTLFAFQECDSTFMNAHAKSGEVSVRYGLVREINPQTKQPTGRCVFTKDKKAGAFYLDGCATTENSSLPFEYFAVRKAANTPGTLEFMGQPAFADGGYPPHRYFITTHDQVVFSNKNSDGTQVTGTDGSQLSFDYNV